MVPMMLFVSSSLPISKSRKKSTVGVVVVERLQQVRVAVGQVREHAAVRIKVAESAVRTSRDAHAIPQPRRAEQLVDDVRATVKLVSSLVQVRGFADVVDLRGDGEDFVLFSG